MNLSKQIAAVKLVRIALLLGVAISLGLAAGWSRPKAPEDDIMAMLGLKSGELVTIAQDQAGKCEMAITMDGQDYMIDYTFFSNRSKQFRLMVQNENGEIVEQEAPTVSTIRGALRGIEGSRVIGCMTEDGCCAKVQFPSGENYYIEPIHQTIDNPAFAGAHVVYSEDEVIASAGQCGTATNLIEAEQEAKQKIQQNLAAASTAPSGNLRVCELALDSDFEYFSVFGSTNATLARMELLVNILNDQYESEVGIRHVISDAVVRPTSSDPFTRSDASDLLNELRSFYNTGGRRFNGDVCHLLTGRNLDGNTVGIAFNGAICSRFFGFGLSQHLNRISSMTDLMAHELGHNWNQPHCNCPNHTMNASLTGANDFNDTLTVPNLIAYRNTRSCLTTVTPTGNDDWNDAINIANPNFSLTGSNFNGTTENQEQNLLNVGSSVWWFVDPSSNGTITVNTFGSDFDTQLHVYEFVPGGGLAGLILIDGNDDANGLLQSQVTFDVTAGTFYEIRVSGFRSSNSVGAGSEGNIVLNGTFTNQATVGDFDADGDVDGDDVDFYVGNLDRPATGDLAQLDLNGDGEVTIADHNLHVTTLAATSNGVTGALLGDVNLDGVVDVLSDALSLVANLGQSVTSRSQGDLNADGTVNILCDAFILIGQLGQSN